jgi:hypothetical protein
VWLPGVINRMQNSIAPNNNLFALFMVHSICVPLQGFLNGLSYGWNERYRIAHVVEQVSQTLLLHEDLSFTIYTLLSIGYCYNISDFSCEFSVAKSRDGNRAIQTIAVTLVLNHYSVQPMLQRTGDLIMTILNIEQ